MKYIYEALAAATGLAILILLSPLLPILLMLGIFTGDVEGINP